MKKALLIPLFLFFIIGATYGQLGEIDPTFNPKIGVGANFTITCVAVQSDGKIIIAGDFTNYGYTPIKRIARLNADGTLDTTFNIGTGANKNITSVALQADGKILIIGDFTAFNDIARNNIARLNSDGTLDNSFIAGIGSNFYKSITVQSDGKIVIMGSITSYNGISRNNIARLNSNGTLDTTFALGVGPNSTVSKAIIQADGKMIIMGSFTSYNGISRSNIAKINPDGTLDTTFDPGTGTTNVVSVAVQADGKILIGGSFTSYNSTPKKRIARLNIDGTLDTTFNIGVGSNGTIKEIAVQADGKILIGGEFTSYDDVSTNRIARLNIDGSLDTTLDPGTGVNAGVNSIAIQTDGKIFIAGSFTSYNETSRGRLVRANSDGTIDTDFFNPVGFGKGANGEIVSIKSQTDGKILIAGSFTSYNSTSRVALIRLNTDGTLDVPFNPFTIIGTPGEGAIEYCVAVQADGKILLSGRHRYGTVFRYGLIRLNSDGTPDETFNVGPNTQNDHIYSIAMQTDGKIIIGGIFPTYTGVAKNRIARLNTDGTIDTTFDSGTGTGAINSSTHNAVYSIAVQPDGKILIGGTFTSYNGVSRNRIARLNADGTLDTTFDPGAGASSQVNAITVQLDGKILIGGSFTSYNGVSRNRIARLNANGTIDSTFNPGSGADDNVQSIKVQLDGKIAIGGFFTSYNGIERNKIAVLNTDGILDTTFDIGAGADSTVRDILIQSDGKIVIAGDFSSYKGSTVNGITRILSSDIALSTEIFIHKSLTVYPNPSTGIFNIDSNQNIENASIKVFDLNGRMIYQSKENVETKVLDLTNSQNGIYILNVENKGYNYSQKIVKQ